MARSTLSDRRTTSEAPPPRVSHARRWFALLTALAAIAVLVVVGIVASGAHGALAQVRVRAGEVHIDRPAKGTLKADDGTDVLAGDIVRTSSDGQGVLGYWDGSVTRLDSSTRLAIRRLVHTKAGRVELALRDGRIWNRVADTSTTGNHYRVTLAHVRIDNDGGSFLTDCRTADVCYVVGFDGTTRVAGTTQATVGPGQCEAIAPDGSLTTCDASKLGVIDEWVRANLAEDQELVTNEPSPSPSPSPSEAPDVGTSSGGGFVPRAVVPRATPRAPSKTAPPSTPAPTTDKNNDGSVPTAPPSPKHRPHTSANP